ncbi:uncharacterized protein PG986_012539 [Apiospora aurea]|uniref:Pleckstrin homology domain-containing protein n=1 Tax=Apiospora aurea TaxID=335848 RepID=A0ABR1Q098_9PEZI
MAAWETDEEVSSPVAASLPTPSDTPYQTPSRKSSRASRRSRRSATPPGASSSPPPMPTEKSSKRTSKIMTAEEPYSMLDPRRFTPTLHANLVSEILNLRRDQEDKLKIIERLEVDLHSTKQDQETEQASLLSTSKENRSLKRQLALLEGGTSSALGELARERDEAVDAVTDTKKRLETAQKKVRSHEEDSQRVHEQWAKERDEWEEEKLKYERRLHVADARMKTILEEVANLQDAQVNRQTNTETDREEAKDNDAASVRTNSLTYSIQFSTIPTEAPGNSLADELNFDSDGYQTEPDGRESIVGRESILGRESVLSNHHNRQFSRDSVMSLQKTHRRDMSSESQMRPGSVARGRMYINQNVLDRLEGGIREDDETTPPPKPEYTDTGVQFSPPPSPKIVPVKPATPEPMVKIEKPIEVESPPRGDTEIEANQRRKRVHIQKPVPFELPQTSSKSMVSAASQTVEAPLSPPTTPKLQQDETFPVLRTRMSTVSTQTDKRQPRELSPAPSPEQPEMLPLLIPSISVHPPTSRPQTPKEHRLPEYVKDFGCQVSLMRTTQTTSIAVQTDEIRVDKRLDRLPPHLHPSAISSRPTSPSAPTAVSNADDGLVFSPTPGNLPPRNPRRLTSRNGPTSSPPASPSTVEPVIKDAYPGNNDDGPLSSQKAPVRRPHRISSLFAGFDGATSDEADELLDGDLSDGEFQTALSAPKPISSSAGHKSRDSAATTSTMDTMPPIPRHGRSTAKHIGTTEVYRSYNLAEDRDTVGRMPAVARPGEKAMNSSTRAGAMRKSALIQSGITSHGRSRSPSLGEPLDPPEAQRSPTYATESYPRRGPRTRSNSIRKVRSAAAMPRTARNRRRGSSPPPMTPSEEAPESPILPPLPKNDITTPQKGRGYGTGRYRGHRSQPSTTTANTDNTNVGSVGSGPQASGVVDAIAQTMVGEWMYKYVRRRKSFGMADTKADETSNDRHKRWVWLAPYERAILWSSKQPSSGSALMGKSGRKPFNQFWTSKTTTQPPKGAGQLFNRSILILTPQRALKFTATSSERHYLWLTSLSFLAHSSQAVPESLSPAPSQPLLKPTSAPAHEPPVTRTKKPTIRDSIRITKGKHPELARPVPLPVSSEQLEDELTPEALSTLNHARDLSREVAEPPFIPRYHDRSTERVHERANQVVLHGRKRSNTGGHIPPPLSFRGFSGPSGGPGSYHTASDSNAGNSVFTADNPDNYAVTSSASHGSTWGMSTNGSVRMSEASSRPDNNFFEAIGTVRMEAFISPLAFPRVQEYPEEHNEMQYRARRRSKEVRRRRSRSRHRDSFNSRTTRGTDDWYAASSMRREEDYFRDDPFKGF